MYEYGKRRITRTSRALPIRLDGLEYISHQVVQVVVFLLALKAELQILSLHRCDAVIILVEEEDRLECTSLTGDIQTPSPSCCP